MADITEQIAALEKVVAELKKTFATATPAPARLLDGALPAPVQVGELILTPRYDNKGNVVWGDQWGFLRPAPDLANNPRGVTSPEQYVFQKHKLDVYIESNVRGRTGKVVAPYDADYEAAVKLVHDDFAGLYRDKGVTKEWAKQFYDWLFVDTKAPVPGWYAVEFSTGPA